MSAGLKVKTDSINVYRSICKEVIKDTLKSKITLPAAALEIIDIEAAVTGLDVRIKKDNLLVKGFLYITAFYVDEDNNLLSGKGRIRIEKNLNVAGVDTGMKPIGKAVVINAESKLIRERTVEISAETEIAIQVISPEKLKFISLDKKTTEALKVKKENVYAEDITGVESFREEIVRESQLPPGKRNVIRTVSSLHKVRTDAGKDIVTVRGSILSKVFYVDDNKLVDCREEETQFKKVLKFAGSNPGMDAYTEIVLNSYPPELTKLKTIKERFTLDIKIKVFDLKCCEIFSEVTGPGVKTVTDALEVENIITNVTLEENIDIVNEMPFLVNRVLYVSGHLYEADTRVRDGQVFIEGELKNIFFLTDEENYFRIIHYTTPLNFSFPLPGGENIKITVIPNPLEEVSYSLEDSLSIKQKMRAGFLVRITDNINIEAVTGIKALKAAPGINAKLYIAQEGDTITKLSRRFNVAPGDLKVANPEVEENGHISPGQRVHIPVPE